MDTKHKIRDQIWGKVYNQVRNQNLIQASNQASNQVRERISIKVSTRRTELTFVFFLRMRLLKRSKRDSQQSPIWKQVGVLGILLEQNGI